jgi:hypothetical protein
MSTLLEPQWLLLIFVGFCLGGAALMARVAGWPSLATTLRAQGEPAGERLRFVTGSLGSPTFPIKYRNCLRLVLNADGFFISLMFPFKFVSPALFVPWSEVESCATEQAFSTQIVVFTLRRQWSQIKLRGIAGQVVREAYERHQNATGADPRT